MVDQGRCHRPCKLKPIHDTFIKKNFKLTKDAYAAQHKEELDTFNKAVRTLIAAWFAGLVIDVNVRVGDLGLRTVLPVIVMGCCVMKYIPPWLA